MATLYLAQQTKLFCDTWRPQGCSFKLKISKQKFEFRLSRLSFAIRIQRSESYSFYVWLKLKQ